MENDTQSASMIKLICSNWFDLETQDGRYSLLYDLHEPIEGAMVKPKDMSDSDW